MCCCVCVCGCALVCGCCCRSLNCSDLCVHFAAQQAACYSCCCCCCCPRGKSYISVSIPLSICLVPLAVFFLDFILFELRFYEFHFTFPYNYFFRVSWLLFCSTRGFILCCICVAATVACVGICAVRDGICGIIKNKRREV